jgi:hypothetical protein
MPKMVYGESTTMIEVPAGRYVARFLGTEPREPIRDSRYGNENAPRMGWLWEVTEGPMRGKKISQESGVRASLKSTAARMVHGLSGGAAVLGAAVNTDDWVGRLYVVKVAPNPNSDKGNLHVADVEPFQPAPAAAPAGNSRVSGGPPPRRRVAPATPPEQSYWVAKSDGADEVKMTFRELQEWVASEHKDPKEVPAIREGEAEWRTAADYDVADTIPW